MFGSRRVVGGLAAALVALVLVGAGSLGGRAAALGPWHLLNAPRAAGRIYGQPACPSVSLCAVIVNDRGHAGVMVSTTEGRSWRASALAGSPSGLEALACPSTTLCLAVGYRGSLLARSALVIERSSDGGASFAPVALPASLTSSGRGDQLEALSCASATTCVAAGQATQSGSPPGCTPPTCTATQAYVTYGLVVLATSDGGVTWTAVSTSGGFEQAYTATCASGGPCQMVGIGLTACTPNGSGGSRCGAAGAAFGVSAGASDPVPTWTSERIPGGVFALNGVACPSATTCVAVGQSADSTLGHGVVLSTRDGGVVWRTLPPPAGTKGLMAIDCPSSRVCLATGGLGGSDEAAVLASGNGGTTWRVVARLPGLSGVERLTCVGAGFCLAAGTVGIGPSEYGVLLGD